MKNITSDLTYASVQEKIDKLGNPAYVLPVSLFTLGRLACRVSMDKQDWWPEEMKAGWNQSWNRTMVGVAHDSGYREAAAFLDAMEATA